MLIFSILFTVVKALIVRNFFSKRFIYITTECGVINMKIKRYGIVANKKIIKAHFNNLI